MRRLREAGGSVLEDVLDLRARLLEVALDPVTAAFGLKAAVTGCAADCVLGFALGRFGFVRDLLADTYRSPPSVYHLRRYGLPVHRAVPEQVWPAALTARLQFTVARRRLAALRAGGLGTGGVALLDQIVAVRGGSICLTTGLL